MKQSNRKLRKYLLSSILIVLTLLVQSVARAESYWTTNIPSIEGASNLERKRDRRFYSVSLSYELNVNNPDDVYEFYNKFFTEQGWENPVRSMNFDMLEFKSKWSSRSSSFNSEGLPEYYFGSVWRSKDMPAMGSVSLKLKDFKEKVFKAKVSVSISPEPDTSLIFELQKLLQESPENIFILSKAVKGNPLEIDKINLSPEAEYEGLVLITEYYQIIEKILKRYEEFGINHKMIQE